MVLQGVSVRVFPNEVVGGTNELNIKDFWADTSQLAGHPERTENPGKGDFLTPSSRSGDVPWRKMRVQERAEFPSMTSTLTKQH